MHLSRIGVIVVLAMPPQSVPQPTSQTAPARDCAISGVVKDAMTGQPIADAIVGLAPVGPRGFASPSQRQSTDEDGRFVFADLVAGDYQVLASKAGYFDSGFGGASDLTQRQAGIQLIAGQWVSAADVQLAHSSSISATVFDERGEPVRTRTTARWDATTRSRIRSPA